MQGNNKSPKEILTNPNGLVFVKKASNLSEFDDGLANADVIAIQNDIVLDSTKTLKPYQTITSNTFVFGNNQSISLGPGGKKLTSSNSEMFTLTQNNQLRDITLNTLPGDFLFKATANIENCQIYNVRSNAKVFVQIADGSTSSSLNVQNSTFSLTAAGTHTLFDLLTKNSSELNTYFAFNQLLAQTDSVTLLKQKVENNGMLNNRGILKNQFSILSGTNNVAIQNEIESTLTSGTAILSLGVINENQVSFFGSGNNTAFLTKTTHSTLSGAFNSTLTIQSLNNNKIYYNELTKGTGYIFENSATKINHQNITVNDFNSNKTFFSKYLLGSQTILLSNSGISNQNITIGTEDGLGGFYLNETRFVDLPNKVGLIQLNNNDLASIQIFINMNNNALSQANFNSEIEKTGNNTNNILIEK